MRIVATLFIVGLPLALTFYGFGLGLLPIIAASVTGVFLAVKAEANPAGRLLQPTRLALQLFAGFLLVLGLLCIFELAVEWRESPRPALGYLLFQTVFSMAFLLAAQKVWRLTLASSPREEADAAAVKRLASMNRRIATGISVAVAAAIVHAIVADIGSEKTIAAYNIVFFGGVLPVCGILVVAGLLGAFKQSMPRAPETIQRGLLNVARSRGLQLMVAISIVLVVYFSLMTKATANIASLSAFVVACGALAAMLLGFLVRLVTLSTGRIGVAAKFFVSAAIWALVSYGMFLVGFASLIYTDLNKPIQGLLFPTCLLLYFSIGCILIYWVQQKD